jgi:hypothetical protein
MTSLALNGKVRCKCIITVSTCGVDSLYSLKLYRIQITIKCIQTYETDRLTLSLWSGKSYELSNCFHWEWMLYTPSILLVLRVQIVPC